MIISLILLATCSFLLRATYFYFNVINIVSFFAYFYDRRQGKLRSYRVAESLLLLLAFMGGWVGSLAGMVLFQHKLKKFSFVALFVVCIVANILIVQNYLL